ncbi:MAG: HAD-IA family hydrolase [Phycisphaerales bacterium]
MPDGAPDTPVRVVCFDWGGVIVRICRSFAEGVRAAGLDLRDGFDEGELYDIRRTAAAEYQVGRMDERAFFEAVSRSMRGTYTLDEISRVHDAWLLEEYPGVRALVDDLHADGTVQTAMLSNTNARHWARRVRDFPTAGTLGHQHASHLLGHAKPDAAIFRDFEDKTGFAGASIVFFDDLGANIDAARAAGWRAVHVDHEGDTASQMRAALVELGVLPTR